MALNTFECNYLTSLHFKGLRQRTGESCPQLKTAGGQNRNFGDASQTNGHQLSPLATPRSRWSPNTMYAAVTHEHYLYMTFVHDIMMTRA